MKTTFKTFYEAMPENTKAWEWYLKAVLSNESLGDNIFQKAGYRFYRYDPLPKNIFIKATRFLDDETIKKITMSCLLKRLKDAEKRDDYVLIKGILDSLRHQAKEHPALDYPELKAIEKSVKAELK